MHSMIATRQFRLSLRRQAETRRRSAYRFIKKIEDLETQNRTENNSPNQAVTNEPSNLEAYRKVFLIS